MPPKLRVAVLRIAGVLLVVLGVLHLFVTPLIERFIRTSVPVATATWLTPPMLLNHIVVGILLLPLGVLTAYAAKSAVYGAPWARMIVRSTAITVATLPLTLFGLMGTRYFGARPFQIATTIVCAASVALLAAAFWPTSTAVSPSA